MKIIQIGAYGGGAFATATNDLSLSTEVIPAVKGEFYSYHYEFDQLSPLYFLLKCKSRKGRPLTSRPVDIEKEHDLTFIFSETSLLCSPDSEFSLELTKDINQKIKNHNHTEIRIAQIDNDTFNECFLLKNSSVIVEHFNQAIEVKNSYITLNAGLVIAVKTDSGKYGLIRIKDISAGLCKVEACHVLL